MFKKTGYILYISLMYFLTVLTQSGYAATRDDYKQKQFDSGVVRIVLFDHSDSEAGHGTGFVINRDGYIVTNHHVIEPILSKNAYGVILNREDLNNPFRFNIIWHSEDKDLAILQADKLSASYEPLAIANSELDSIKDSEIIAAGFPAVSEEADLNRMVEAIHKGGHVSAKRTMKKEKAPWLLFEHSAAIHEGMSGGPVADRCGRVVGVTSFYIAKPADVYVRERGGYEEADPNEIMILGKADGVNLAIRSIELINVLDREKIDYQYDSSSCTTGFHPQTVYAVIATIVALFSITLFFVWRRSHGNARGFAKIARRMAEISHIVRSNKNTKSPTVISGTGKKVKGMVLQVPKEVQVIGRDPTQCNIILEIDTVSSRHARIGWDQDKKVFWVEDVGSTHGTFVDGKKIEPLEKVSLRNRDVIYFSEPEISFRFENKD